MVPRRPLPSRCAVFAVSVRMWRSQAEAEGLTLLEADNKTGYFGVSHNPGQPKPYQARVRRGVAQVCLGSFATAEEAALYIARSPEGQESAKRAAAAAPAPPLTSEGGAAAGAGAGADAAQGRQQDGLLRREAQQAR